MTYLDEKEWIESGTWTKTKTLQMQLQSLQDLNESGLMSVDQLHELESIAKDVWAKERIKEIKKNHTNNSDYAIGLCHELIARTIEVFGKKRISQKDRDELYKQIQWADIADEIRKLTEK